MPVKSVEMWKDVKSVNQLSFMDVLVNFSENSLLFNDIPLNVFLYPIIND